MKLLPLAAALLALGLAGCSGKRPSTTPIQRQPAEEAPSPSTLTLAIFVQDSGASAITYTTTRGSRELLPDASSKFEKIDIIMEGLFRPNSSVLGERATGLLGAVPKLLRDFAVRKVEILGYVADDDDRRSDMPISTARAKSVYAWLASHRFFASVPAETRGMGRSNPVGDNSTPLGRLKNRRVELDFAIDTEVRAGTGAREGAK